MLDDDDFKGIETKLIRSIEDQRELRQKIDSINELLEALLYRNNETIKPIIAVGGANAEIILESYGHTDLNFGEKYTVSQRNNIGGSAVNFSYWLLDNNKFVLPILVIGEDQVGKNIREIISPFIKNISSPAFNLTQTEIQVANLVKQGMSTKEIASAMNLSTNTIMTHRAHIREKLNLVSKKGNLYSRLSDLE